MAVAEYPIRAVSQTEELSNQPTFSRPVEDVAEPIPQHQLVIRLVHEEGQFVAIEPVSAMFGEGETEVEAVQDLILGLGELRSAMEASEPNLSDDLRNRLDFLRSF